MTDAFAESPATATERPRAVPSFPIAGIGASAGGLAAVVRLLQSLGGDPGIAFVLISHLDPTHESSLVEILSKVTPMPVRAARDGDVVEPNRLYVMSPGTELVIAGGTLRIVPRSGGAGPHMPIDRFFRAIAEDLGRRAVGIVLSGTGSDGSLGIQAIKGEEGTTFAQDETAEHGDMPRNAIVTGAVDFVYPPERIAKELCSVGARSPMVWAAGGSSDDESMLRILLALRQATGVDFSEYKRTTLFRRTQRRALVHRLSTLAEYADLVASEASEAVALSEEILIHVTRFFRDADTFRAIEGLVLPVLAERRDSWPVRVWVPGCSTGEEVYSLAIAILEFFAKAGIKDSPVTVFGTDISSRAIDRARAGRYPENISQDVSPARLLRFFSKTDGAYQIVQEVRDKCIFSTQNVISDPPFSNLDFISCRNLMIYLDPALQQRLLPLLHYGLRPAGFLLLGSSEGVGAFPGFAPVDAKHRIFVRIPYGGRPLVHFGGRGWVPTGQVDRPPGERLSSMSQVREIADRAIAAAIGPAGVVVNDQLMILEFRGDVSPFLRLSPGMASLDLLRLAREELRLELRRAIDEACATDKPVRRAGVVGGSDGDPKRSIDLRVIPFLGLPAKSLFLAVLFEETPSVGAEGEEVTKTPSQAATEADLRRELASTREYLQSVVERLEASNEELRALGEETTSSNEELHSTNEELQTAKEELQATNEELRTINDEMIERNTTTTRLADDLTNVLASVAIPIVILDRDSRIRRFTPSAAPILNLIGADIGRPLSDIRPKIRAPDLPKMIGDVLRSLMPAEKTVEGEDGRWYRLTIRPYLTADHRVDGAVLSVFDIDALKKVELLLAEARDYAEGIVETVRESLIVLDREMRIQSANAAFYETFKLVPAKVENRLLFELDGGVWDCPEFLQLIEKSDASEIRIDRTFPRSASRVFLVTCRRIASTPWLLLALNDITENARADVVRRSEASFRQMLTAAAGGIVMSDTAGHIVFANEAISRMLGYAADELYGMNIDDLCPTQIADAHGRHRAAYSLAPTPRPMGRDRDLVARHRDGREVPIEVVLSPMDATEGPVVVAFITDITARRQAERSILEYQEKLQRMAFDATVAEEHERRRIAGDLHDRIGQALAAAQLKLRSANERTQGEARDAIQQALDLVAQTIADTRTLMFDLSPPVLYDLGFREALSWLAEEVEGRHGVHVEITEHSPRALLDETTAAILFRSVRELLMNVIKHSEVRQAHISLLVDLDRYEIEVRDSGCGFDLDAATRPSGSGFGLFSIREQMSRLGGTFQIAAAPSKGTCVTLRVPIAAARAPESASGGEHENTTRGRPRDRA
jgi:two-component system CheB/CheR fusion protein